MNEPKNVKELLVELKDASELMVDLAYAAVFFNEEKLAREVGRLEERMNGHLRRLRIMAMLAARSPEDAEGMAGVLWIADAIERIGDAASDIARVVAARLGIPDALRQDLRHADEMTARVKIRSDAPAAGRTLRDLSLPTETGMWVMAIRSGMDWRFDPGPDDVVSEHDVLLDPRAGGGREPGARARRRGAPPRVPRRRHPRRSPSSIAPSTSWWSSRTSRRRRWASRIRRCSSTTSRSRPRSARWRRAATSSTTSWSRGCSARRPKRATPTSSAVSSVSASASEYVCDSARDMTWYVEHGEPLHPVVQMALEETEETFAETVVEDGSNADGTSLRDLRVETETGMFVLAVQRGSRWTYRPRAGFVLQAGDRLISVGPEEGEDELLELCSAGHPVGVEG